MNFYFEQKRDKILAESRLHTLRKKRESIEKQINKITTEYSDAINSNNFSDSKYDNYLIKLEDMNAEIEIAEDNLKTINEDLEKMNNAIKDFDGIEGRIFNMIETYKLNPTQIIAKTGYSKSTVYRKLQKINEKLTFGKK